jgi:hypothetical protein
MIDVEGEEALEYDEEFDLRCVGCEYGSGDDKPIRLSTDRPS